METIPAQFDVSTFVKDIARQILQELRTMLATEQTKEYYTTEELAAAMKKKPYTVREHWCNAGRVECEKDEAGKWRIPGHEYRRLVNGGGIRPKR
jgi:Mn-dependent DtxR family transcriptional regulator